MSYPAPSVPFQTFNTECQQKGCSSIVDNSYLGEHPHYDARSRSGIPVFMKDHIIMVGYEKHKQTRGSSANLAKVANLKKLFPIPANPRLNTSPWFVNVEYNKNSTILQKMDKFKWVLDQLDIAHGFTPLVSTTVGMPSASTPIPTSVATPSSIVITVPLAQQHLVKIIYI